MTYSIIGILAAIILIIINQDVLRKQSTREMTVVQKNYRLFLIGVFAYLFTDMMWGILDSHHLIPILYADTVVHFIAMAAAVMFWMRYVVSYLDDKSLFGKLLNGAGILFVIFEIIAVTINIFYPIMFWFDESGTYQASIVRYINLIIQIMFFLLISIYTLKVATKTEGTVKRRHMTIGFYGLAMTIFIAIQIFYPLWPFYAMGYMLGTCLLHSFVVEDEKEEARRKLEESREALRDALAEAENANKAKTTFLSNMSHEIRTPMNAIIGLNNIAMNDPSINDDVKDYMEKMSGSAQHLLGIINDILDMSRIESGRMVIKNEEFSFAKQLEQINTIIGGQCNDKGLVYECRIKGKIDDYYIGDAMKLKQIMINILGNAVKFTPEGGKVEFIIEEGQRLDRNVMMTFTIRDTGIGMSKEYLPHIFEAFSQEDSSYSNKYGSTGLGMPITKSLVELMNGHIEVESEQGKGTTFTVTLTLLESDRQAGSAEYGKLDPNEMSVLVIDDDRIALEHAEIVLGQVNIRCDTAESGEEGVDKVRIKHARNEDYDLILVDWKMPEMDGLETTRKIRDCAGDKTPIIILTSYNWDDIADDAIEAGVDTFVPKPLFADSVLDEFREAFRKKNESLAEKTTDLEGRRVLLAEDMAINAEIIVMILSMRKVEAEVAENGRIAVEMFERSEAGYYDAILMDMRMPEMDGLEATRKIRSMEREDAKKIPIIALTANAFDEDVQRSLQAGLNAHLSKPVEPEALFDMMQSLIG